MFDQLLENTILLFVAVDPIALVPIFASLTQGLNKEDIRKIYIQATVVSFFILSLFYLFGTAILDVMGNFYEFLQNYWRFIFGSNCIPDGFRAKTDKTPKYS
jgi:small neutral amino acid transporter SnatA (MarC family)